ncbi:serine hydrolase [Secundilactobacillus yichangensis]|uniref:serine hydrolase n=1 Tax=Secundilactobacillus yichangensis TaxID=2799580 RepID=UPI00194235E8|nr:serine hydrolase [Secundilactobacillus yichangensis]
MKSKFYILGTLAIAGMLTGCGVNNHAKTVARSSSSTETSQKASNQQPQRVINPQRVHVPHLRASTNGTATEWVGSNSSAGLVNVINQSMRGIQPGTQGPAKWTVAVSSLDGNQQAYMTNWSPGHAQSSASTIKLFILIRYYQELKKGTIHPNDTYTLQQADKVSGSGILLHKKVGTQYTVKELVRLMIEKSDNIATNVLISKLGGFSGVNQTISTVVGPTHYSSLERKMMDTSNINNGKSNRINAWEAVQTLRAIYRGHLIDPSTDQAMLAPMLKTENRTKLPAKLPSGAICWNKSGESNYRGVENDMAIIKYQGHVFMIAALIELDGDGQTPHNATQEQTESQVAAIARLGANVTNWMVQ